MCFSSPKVQQQAAPPPPPPPPTPIAQRVETPRAQREGGRIKRKRGTSQLTVQRSGGVSAKATGTGVNLNQ